MNLLNPFKNACCAQCFVALFFSVCVLNSCTKQIPEYPHKTPTSEEKKILEDLQEAPYFEDFLGLFKNFRQDFAVLRNILPEPLDESKIASIEPSWQHEIPEKGPQENHHKLLINNALNAHKNLLDIFLMIQASLETLEKKNNYVIKILQKSLANLSESTYLIADLVQDGSTVDQLIQDAEILEKMIQRGEITKANTQKAFLHALSAVEQNDYLKQIFETNVKKEFAALDYISAYCQKSVHTKRKDWIAHKITLTSALVIAYAQEYLAIVKTFEPKVNVDALELAQGQALLGLYEPLKQMEIAHDHVYVEKLGKSVEITKGFMEKIIDFQKTSIGDLAAKDTHQVNNIITELERYGSNLNNTALHGFKLMR